MNEAGIVVFSGSNCPACVMAERWLTQNGIPFQKFDVDGNKELIDMLKTTTGQRTVPQFFVDGQHLPQGFNQLKTVVASRYPK